MDEKILILAQFSSVEPKCLILLAPSSSSDFSLMNLVTLDCDLLHHKVSVFVAKFIIIISHNKAMLLTVSDHFSL